MTLLSTCVYNGVKGCSINVAFDISAWACGSMLDLDFNGGGSGSSLPKVRDNDFDIDIDDCFCHASDSK